MSFPSSLDFGPSRVFYIDVTWLSGTAYSSVPSLGPLLVFYSVVNARMLYFRRAKDWINLLGK